MSVPVARLGDTSTHGGKIVTAACKTMVEGIPVARMGDKLACKKHGLKTIVTGSSKTMVEGAPVARLGDKASCGAMLIPATQRTESG